MFIRCRDIVLELKIANVTLHWIWQKILQLPCIAPTVWQSGMICLLIQGSPPPPIPLSAVSLSIAYQCCPPSDCRRLRFRVIAVFLRLTNYYFIIWGICTWNLNILLLSVLKLHAQTARIHTTPIVTIAFPAPYRNILTYLLTYLRSAMLILRRVSLIS